MLRTSLDKHTEITCHHELFNQDVSKRLENSWKGEHVPTYLQRMDNGINTGVCVQSHHFQLRPEAYEELVLMELPTIILFRRNVLEQYVSREVAKRNNQWEVYKDESCVNPRPVEIDVRKFLECLQRKREQLAQTINDFPNSIVVTYEQLCERYHPTMEKIQTFLGVCYERLSPDSVKVLLPLHRMILNSEGVHHHLQKLNLDFME